MSQAKVFYSFAELADHARFEAKKNRPQPKKLPPPPVQPVLTSHEKPKIKGRINAKQRRG